MKKEFRIFIVFSAQRICRHNRKKDREPSEREREREYETEIGRDREREREKNPMKSPQGISEIGFKHILALFGKIFFH